MTLLSATDLAVGEREEIEEERRLLYVAMTRAKDSLHLVTPQRFFVHGQASRGDKHVYASRTRFILITRWIVLHGWLGQRHRANAKGSGSARPDVRLDLRARMRGMWR